VVIPYIPIDRPVAVDRAIMKIQQTIDVVIEAPRHLQVVDDDGRVQAEAGARVARAKRRKLLRSLV
jgi:hypothetical protein